MGAYAPVPESIASAEQIARVVSEVAQPTIDGMAADGTPYHGLLYCQVSMALAGQGLDVLSRRGRVHALLEWREKRQVACGLVIRLPRECLGTR